MGSYQGDPGKQRYLCLLSMRLCPSSHFAASAASSRSVRKCCMMEDDGVCIIRDESCRDQFPASTEPLMAWPDARRRSISLDTAINGSADAGNWSLQHLVIRITFHPEELESQTTWQITLPAKADVFFMT